jgi:hypothetical protein
MAVIFGLDGGLWAIDASSGRSRWRNDAPPLAATRPVIATQGRILITDPDYELRAISTIDGTHSDPLDTRGRLGSAFQSLRAATSQGNTILASTVGTVIHDPEGKVVGFDARPLTGPLLPAIVTQNYFIQVDSRGGPIDDGNGYPRLMTIHGLESGAAVADAIVMLPEERTVTVGVLDGFILISSDQATTVIAAPTGAAKPAPANPLP